MKLLLATFAFIFSATSFAADLTSFHCRTLNVVEGKTQSTFSFIVEGLNSSNGKVNYWVKKDADDPVTMNPAESTLDLNDNSGIELTDKGLVLTSDGDGFQFVTVTLYKDKEYKFGNAVLKPGSGAEVKGFFTPVSCTVK